MAASLQTSTTEDREITISRVFDAPRELVWRAFTEPEHLIQWWGPDGFTNTFHEIDIRPGGVWRFIMRGPDGTDYDNVVVFREVVAPERLVYDHGNNENPRMFEAFITLEDRDGKTEVTMRMVLESAEMRTRMVEEVGAVEGGEQTLGRLAVHLTRM